MKVNASKEIDRVNEELDELYNKSNTLGYLTDEEADRLMELKEELRKLWRV